MVRQAAEHKTLHWGKREELKYRKIIPEILSMANETDIISEGHKIDKKKLPQSASVC